MNHPGRGNHRTSILGIVLGAVTSIAGACSTQSNGAPEPGDSVLVPGTSHVVARSLGGGYGPVVPAGAACHHERSFELALPHGDLTWSVCRVQGDYNDPSQYVLDSGTRTLDSSQRTQALAAIGGVKVSSGDTCGADLDAREIEVTSGGDTTKYGDDFYACLKVYDHYVSTGGLANLMNTLDGMTQ